MVVDSRWKKGYRFFTIPFFYLEDLIIVTSVNRASLYLKAIYDFHHDIVNEEWFFWGGFERYVNYPDFLAWWIKKGLLEIKRRGLSDLPKEMLNRLRNSPKDVGELKSLPIDDFIPPDESTIADDLFLLFTRKYFTWDLPDIEHIDPIRGQKKIPRPYYEILKKHYPWYELDPKALLFFDFNSSQTFEQDKDWYFANRRIK